MLVNATIISLIVIFIHLTLQPKEIFGFVSKWFTEHLPAKIHKPVFDCPICMTPWWGSLVMAVACIVGIEGFQHVGFWDWIFILAIAAGISTVFVEWKPKKEIAVIKNQEP